MNILSVSSSRREANTLSFFLMLTVYFLSKKRQKKRINKKRTFIHALRNVDILSVAHDSAGWFSLSFDDEDDLIVEDDDEDDDG